MQNKLRNGIIGFCSLTKECLPQFIFKRGRREKLEIDEDATSFEIEETAGNIYIYIYIYI